MEMIVIIIDITDTWSTMTEQCVMYEILLRSLVLELILKFVQCLFVDRIDIVFHLAIDTWNIGFLPFLKHTHMHKILDVIF